MSKAQDSQRNRLPGKKADSMEWNSVIRVIIIIVITIILIIITITNNNTNNNTSKNLKHPYHAESWEQPSSKYLSALDRHSGNLATDFAETLLSRLGGHTESLGPMIELQLIPSKPPAFLVHRLALAAPHGLESWQSKVRRCTQGASLPPWVPSSLRQPEGLQGLQGLQGLGQLKNGESVELVVEHAAYLPTLPAHLHQ